MKRKKGKVILGVTALLLVTVLATGVVLMKGVLNRIGRTYDEEPEIIAPEDEFFDVDTEPVTEIPQDPTVDTPIDMPVDTPPVTEPENPAEPDTGAADPADGETSGATMAPEDVPWSPVERVADDHLINILVIGQDGGWTPTTRRQRTDSMILCSVNPATGEASLISFLRDLYVQIPGGYSDNRLNVPYVLGGFDLLKKTLQENFGVSVDVCVRVNFKGFEDIVNYFGGLEVTLSAKEVEYIERVWKLDVHEGVNTLTGAYALNYVRMRKVDSDFGRATRQRTVILTLLNKVKNLPMNELLTLMYDMLPNLSIDATDAEILSMAYRLLPLLPSMQIETHTVPARGTYRNASIRGMSVLLPDRELIREKLISEYLPLG